VTCLVIGGITLPSRPVWSRTSEVQPRSCCTCGQGSESLRIKCHRRQGLGVLERWDVCARDLVRISMLSRMLCMSFALLYGQEVVFLSRAKPPGWNTTLSLRLILCQSWSSGKNRIYRVELKVPSILKSRGVATLLSATTSWCDAMLYLLTSAYSRLTPS